ncbi:thiamine pyrophosphate-dependent enzyme [Terriglobus aquaticus]|uniref:Uncharacterized protein n=1 Tax=Terriglobus aquaticus TaxID=940139 RepID=A0ABW9KJ77_9BACT|nr:hypothetical protein [Terriglobus aquaticus]
MGKPLISDAQMLAMHATMLQLRQAAPRRSAAAAPGAWPIALLAATLLQLRSDDLLVTAGDLPLAETALRSGQQSSFHPDLLPFSLACAPDAAAAVAAGYALAQSHTTRPGDHAPLTMAMLGPGTPRADALQLAGQHLLPLLLVVRDEPGKPRPPITAPPHVEVVPVDAEDAVAVCRVMQESTLRARNRWGSVVLRAVTLPDSADPIAALEAHLERRGILPALSKAETR